MNPIPTDRVAHLGGTSLSRSLHRPMILLVLALGLASVLAAPNVRAQDTAATVRRRAPHSNIKDSLRRDSIFKRLGAVANHLGKLVLDIPEYHDEQRFPIDSNTAYGPMVYIFGSPFLEGFKSVNQINAHGDYGHFVAVVYVDTNPGATLPAPYAALHLVAGTNCVYLAHQGADSTVKWRAFVLPAAAATDACERPTPATLALAAVARRNGIDTRLASYPAVTRFDEAMNGQPLLGVRCLNAWCQIGPAGFPVRKPSHFADAVLNSLPEGRIQAWHDDQILAVVDPASGHLVPKGPRATVTPTAGLDTAGRKWYTGTWRRVAVIWLASDPAGTRYGARWGMQKGRNNVQVKYDAAGWHARLIPEGSTVPVELNIEYHFHPDIVVPGTARFRWVMNDEAMWVGCDQGCCRIDALM